jgi:hypothetical protein
LTFRRFCVRPILVNVHEIFKKAIFIWIKISYRRRVCALI